MTITVSSCLPWAPGSPRCLTWSWWTLLTKKDENIIIFNHKIDDQQGILILKFEVQMLEGSKLDVEATSTWNLVSVSGRLKT